MSFPLPADVLEDIELIIWFFSVPIGCYGLCWSAERVMDVIEGAAKKLRG